MGHLINYQLDVSVHPVVLLFTPFLLHLRSFSAALQAHKYLVEPLHPYLEEPPILISQKALTNATAGDQPV